MFSEKHRSVISTYKEHRLTLFYHIVASIKGNTIKLATALGEMKGVDTLVFLGILSMYALGCLLFRTFIHINQNKMNEAPHLAARDSIAPVALALFALSDFIFYKKSLQTGFRGHVLPLALGFGLLNSATTDAMGGTITFAMTGHVSKVAQGTSDWLFSGRRRFRSAAKMSFRIFSCFLIGVVIGTFLNGIGPQRLMKASGLGLSSIILEQHLPVFTIIGALAVITLQLHDHPLPNIMHFLLHFRKNRRLDITVNKWSPQSSL